MPRLEARFPFGGRSDATAKADQPLLTTAWAENVVGWHGFTGSQQGGQRPGLSPLLDNDNPPLHTEGVAVQWGGTFSVHEPAFVYTTLGNPLSGGTAGDIEEDWGFTSADRTDTWDVAVTLDGDAFFLSGDSVVTRRNSAGEEVYRVDLPATAGQRAARSMALDDDGNLYVGSSSVGATDGAYVWKFTPRFNSAGKETGMDLAWEALIDDTADIVAVRYFAARLYVGYNTQTQMAEIAVLSGLEATEPAVVSRSAVPYPLGDIDVSTRGAYFTSKPNADRLQDTPPAGFSVSEVDWTPHDLSDAAERLHFWVDASEAGTYPSGAEVPRVPDRRFLEGEAVHDTTVRDLIRSRFWDPASGAGNRPPTFGPQAGGVLPGLQFNGGAGTATSFGVNFNEFDNGSGLTNIDPVPVGNALPNPFGDKPTTTSSLPRSTGAWPFTTHGRSITWLWRYYESGSPMVLWTVGIPDPYVPVNNYLAIVINWDATAAHPAYNSNWWQDPAGEHRQGCISVIKSVNGDQDRLAAFTTVANFDAVANAGTENRFAMVTLNRNPDGSGLLRVNGKVAHTFAANELFSVAHSSGSGILPTFQSGVELWGNRMFFERETPENRYLREFDSFSGVLCECVTAFCPSSSATSPHDTADSATGSPSAFDYERLEGYIAHKWGVAQAVLGAGHPFVSTPPSGSGGFTATLSQETDVALRSPYGILGKLQPGLGGVQWAVAGAGMGYSVRVTDEGHVFCAGPRQVPESLLNEDGPQARILMKGIDRGLSLDWTEPSFGEIRLDAVPPNGATMAVTDTAGDTFTFVFHDTADPGGADYWVDTSSADSDTIQADIINTITVSSVVDIFADVPLDDGLGTFPRTIYFWARGAADGVARPIVLTGITTEIEVVSGMTAASAPPAGTWERRVNETRDLGNESMRMDVDDRGDLYVPMAYSGKANHVVKYAGNGQDGRESELWTHQLGGSADVFDVHAVAVDRRVADRFPATGPEYLYVASSNVETTVPLSVDDDRDTQHRLRLIKSTPRVTKTRSTRSLAVSNGSIYVVTPYASANLIAADAFKTNSTFVTGFSLYQQVFLIDAGTYKLYNLRTGAIRDWVAATSGELPEGAMLGCAYRGRAVLARVNGDPHNLYASATGDPFDWNTDTRIATFTRAFSGSSEQTSRNPDIINALVPFYDDVLIVGGDRSIATFSGDLSEAASINLFTTATGMAFGDSWAMDPEGFIYFFGSRGGVWAMAPAAEGRAQPPVEITDQVLHREFNGYDLSRFRFRLLWDEEMKALHVYQMRRDPSLSPMVVGHWFWEKRSRAWWPVRIENPDMQPSCAWVSDGDEPDDRFVAVGCEDGRVRYWNPNTAWDDGTRIHSSVLIGPLLPQDPAFEARITALEAMIVLGEVEYEVFSSDTPADLGEPILRGKLQPGMSGSIRRRARGGTLWIRLTNAALSQTWALEKLYLEIEPAGRRRVRTV